MPAEYKTNPLFCVMRKNLRIIFILCRKLDRHVSKLSLDYQNQVRIISQNYLIDRISIISKIN